MSRARTGTVPPLADAYVARPGLERALADALTPGATAVLVPVTAMGAATQADSAVRGGDLAVRDGDLPAPASFRNDLSEPDAASAPAPVPAAGRARGWRESCGKTQLAVAYAESAWASGDADILVWVTASSRAAVLSGLAEAAAAAGAADLAFPIGTVTIAAAADGTAADGTPADGTGPGQSAEDEAAGFLALLRGTSRPWLVVLDDLTGPAVMEGLWPQGPAGRTLITSARPDILPPGIEATVIPVGELTSHEALGYLMNRLTTDLDQRQGAIDLVGQLSNEPLALAQASAVIASSDLTCRGYLDHFLARRESGHEQPAAGPGLPASALTWALAVEHADNLVPGMAHPLLMFTSLLDGAGVPGTVFEEAARCAGVSPAASRDGLAALQAAGLLSIDAAQVPPLIRMNWAVQAAIRAAAPPGVLAATAVAAADAVLAAWPADEQPPSLARALRGCANSLAAVAGEALWGGGCPRVLLRAGQSLEDARLPGLATSYWEELAAEGDRVLGAGHPDAVAIRERLGLTCLGASMAGKAVGPFRSVLNELARSVGENHPGIARACQNLGRALVAAGRLDEGIAALEDAAARYERSTGAESAESVAAQEDLAAAHSRAGRAAAAVTLYRRTLVARQRLQGWMHPETMATCRKLADAHLAEGQVKNAISLYKRILEEREKALGAQDPAAIEARGALASAYFAAGKVSRSLQLLEQVRTEYSLTIGANHKTTLATSLTLANAYHSVGRLMDAALLLQDTVERCERSLPAHDPLTLAARAGLAAMRGDD